MRIAQCHISKSVADFPWLSIYSLDDYQSVEEPAIFFGMYRYEDATLLFNHKGPAIVFWTGQDALQEKWQNQLKVFTYRNVTAHPKVAKYIRSRGYECELVKPSSFLNDFWPQMLGTGVYAYCPSSMPQYHGYKVIEALKCAGYEIVVGDGSISQENWKQRREEFYKDICIGLCLSSFAGGGTSIIEMGLRGVRVVTNVFSLPHTLPWVDNGDVEQSAQHIAGVIDRERQRVGTRDRMLAKVVYDALDHQFEWLNLEL